jgi:hypothetical protein
MTQEDKDTKDMNIDYCVRNRRDMDIDVGAPRLGAVDRV